MCNLGKIFCYLQLQSTMLSCFLKHKGLNFQFDHLIYLFFFLNLASSFFFFSCENEQGLLCLTCEWSEKHLTTFQNAFRATGDAENPDTYKSLELWDGCLL